MIVNTLVEHKINLMYNICLLYTSKLENGYEYITKVSINKALRDYFALNLLSLKAVTAKSEKLLDKKSLVPLINNNEVIIPIKTIKPLVKGDRAFGYINYSKVKEVRDGFIIFKNRCV